MSFIVTSSKRVNQLMRLIPKLANIKKHNERRAEAMLDPENKYYVRWGFDRDEELAEAAQATRISQRAFRLLGMGEA